MCNSSLINISGVSLPPCCQRWRPLTNYVYENLKVYDFVNWIYKNLNQCIIMSL